MAICLRSEVAVVVPDDDEDGVDELVDAAVGGADNDHQAAHTKTKNVQSSICRKKIQILHCQA